MVSQSISGNTRRSTVSQWLVVAVSAGIVLSAGALYGHFSSRWGASADLVAAGSHLDSFPDQLGKWQLVEELPMDNTTLNMLECAGYVNRRYVNQESGEEVRVAIIVGPAGPTAVHTPEICYSSRAYDLQDQRRSVVISAAADAEHTFWCVDFKMRHVLAEQLRVYYAWSLGERWEAATSPRVSFAAEPMLYKIQLASTIPPAVQAVDSDPCRQFLEELLESGWAIKPD